jgi:fumarylpyruvate hydrolase
MTHVIPLWDIPSLAVRDSEDLYPVRRIFCVGRNYVEHQKEMGGDGRETPFFFLKAAHSLVPGGGNVHFPPKTANYHYETEMVVAIGKGGRRIDAKKANEHVYGYGVGLDMTRRDLQQLGMDNGRPWDFGKDFDEAAPCSALVPAAKIGHPAFHPSKGAIWLKVNGKERQKERPGTDTHVGSGEKEGTVVVETVAVRQHKAVNDGGPDAVRAEGPPRLGARQGEQEQ